MSPRDATHSFAGLPEVLRDIAEVAGLEAAMAIARDRAGLEITIPHEVGPDHWLTRIVGKVAAQKICDHFAVHDADGHPVWFRTYLPFNDATLMGRAVAELEQAIATENIGTYEAVRRFGLSERTVKRARARLRAKHQYQLEFQPSLNLIDLPAKAPVTVTRVTRR